MKGFVSILEAFLAISLIYIMLSQVQISIPPRYSDSTNIERLNTYAHDIAFSICGNMKMRRMMLNDSLNFDLSNVIPPDICYKISVYKNSSNNHLLDSLVYNYTAQNQTITYERVEIFYDEFANLDAWYGDKASSDEWFANTTYGYNNSNCADKDNYTADDIIHDQSTEGYSNINVSVWYRVTLYDAGEYLHIEWYNGTGWSLLFDRPGAQGDGQWYYNSSILPPAAENNPNFKIKIRCYDWHAQRSEWNYDRCQVDSLRITGLTTHIESTRQCNLTSTTPLATSSCLIAGGPNATNYSAYDCRSSCLDYIVSSNDFRVNLINGQNFTVAFSPSRNGSIVEFYLEGQHNQSGTTYLYDSAGIQIAAYNFTVGSDEGHIFDLSDFFPDSNGVYNITVKPNVNASYDYAYLNVSTNTYSPRRIVVQTWNYGD